jgi:hypothetical protein
MTGGIFEEYLVQVPTDFMRAPELAKQVLATTRDDVP